MLSETNYWIYNLLEDNSFKINTYENIFKGLEIINGIEFLPCKIDTTILLNEMFGKVQQALDNTEAIADMDFILKDTILKSLEENGIIISFNTPLYILSDIINTIGFLYEIDKNLVNELVDVLDAVETSTSYTYLFNVLLSKYSLSDLVTLSEYIENVNGDVVLSLKRYYEDLIEDVVKEENDVGNIDSIIMFKGKFNIDGLTYKQVLKDIINHNLFKKKFTKIFPYLNKILIDCDNPDKFLDNLCISYLASEEGYDNPLENIKVLDEYSLSGKYENIPNDVFIFKFKERIKSSLRKGV